MDSRELVDRIMNGAEGWNIWRSYSPDALIDLSGANLFMANLSNANLSGVNLSNANLGGANLSVAKLSGANLSVANLTGANLRGATLIAANLYGANLINANLRRADLRASNLSEAHLSDADFSEAHTSDADLSGATVGWTTFGSADLSSTKGLDSVSHLGPSTIGIDTIYKSGGKIPDAFLRGAGVPDNFISYMGSLVGKPFEYYSCFISYSTKDQTFAERLHADLQAKGVRCWFAPHNVAGGRKLYEQIDEAIRLYDRLLLILSVHSMESEWVKTEIAKARKREQKEKRQMLFPIRMVEFNKLIDWKCFDADTGKDSAREIREYFIPDFSDWRDHDCYEKALKDLLRDLNAKT